MSYATLRGHSDRPLTQHMHQSPTESPCRDCEYRTMDKNEFPACINCIKRDVFQIRPINLDIKHDPDLPKPRKRRHYPQYRSRRSDQIPVGAQCSVDGCDKPARYRFFKDLYMDLLCHNHYLRIYRRHKRTGTIYDKDGNL